MLMSLFIAHDQMQKEILQKPAVQEDPEDEEDIDYILEKDDHEEEELELPSDDDDESKIQDIAA